MFFYIYFIDVTFLFVNICYHEYLITKLFLYICFVFLAQRVYTDRVVRLCKHCSYRFPKQYKSEYILEGENIKMIYSQPTWT